MKEEKNVENCKDPKILDIHKDRECNGDFCCDYCEEKEAKWHIAVSKKYKSMNNIFINPKLEEIFIEKWLDGVLHLKDTEQERIKFIWPPIRGYNLRKYLSNFGNKRDNYELDEYVSNLIKERDKTYHGYYLRPKVEFEFIRDLRYSLDDYSIHAIYPFKECPNQFNEIYLFLSHILSYIPNMLYIDKKRCMELIVIFRSLLDE